MIYEYAVDPDLLSNEHNCRTIFDNFKQVNGKLISDSPKQWIRRAYHAINQGNYQPVMKTTIKRNLDKLSKESLIENRKAEMWIPGLVSWLHYINSQNVKYPYAAVICDEKVSEPIISYKLSSLFVDAPDCWNSLTQKPVKRIAKNMIDAIEPLLSISKEVMLIDPHIYPHESKYRNVIREILFRANRYNFGRGINKITIHTSDRRMRDMQSSLERGLFSFLPNGFEIIVRMWPENMMHDRYIITDIAGIKFGIGLDEATGNTVSDVEINIISSEIRKDQISLFSNSNKESGFASISK